MGVRRFVANPDLLVVQASLYAPAYSGPGKWLVFDPWSRRAFLAVGKDVLPAVIPLLITASREPVSEGHLGPVEPNQQIERLLSSGLLLEDDAIPAPFGRSFVSRFHLANFDYPFPDYSDPNWGEADRATMRQYGAASPPPPPKTPREGVLFKLPDVFVHDLLPQTATTSSGLTITGLASVLRFVFGPLGEIDGGDFGPWLRKSSPSGGARHPTECILLLTEGLCSISPGAYTYDVERHGLVALETADEGLLAAVRGDGIGFLITSRVERPMWRYRDIRSLRPVLLDAGHVVETLVLLLGLQGVRVRVLPPVVGPAGLSWIVEPELALVIAQPVEPSTTHSIVSEPTDTSKVSSQFTSFLTNPTLFLTFSSGNLEGHVLWPSARKLDLNTPDFDVLTHCLPSRRGDRLTTRIDILDAIPGMEGSRIDALSDVGALLPKDVAVHLYDEATLWVRHGWYLSLLAHAEIRAGVQKHASPHEQRAVPMETCTADEVVQALMLRRTTRAFVRKPIPFDVVERILREILSLIEPCPSIGVFLATLDVGGLVPALYQWDDRARRLTIFGECPSRDEIRAMTIGQEWAGSGALVIWLVRRLDLEQPWRYEFDILEMGRIGQRICLAVTVMGLGVFLTPAVADSRTFDWLGIPFAREAVAYMFTVGPRRS